jgi:uroporphyrinogen III methyltransferase/synthase
LAGRRVVVTRPVGQSRELVDRLTALGAEAVELPLTMVVPIAEGAQIDQALEGIATYGVIVVTSANGAACFVEQLAARGVAPAQATTLVAVGAATAATLRAHGLVVDRIPQRATGGAIVAELADVNLVGVRILLPRALVGRPELPAGLRRAGAVVDDVPFYETVRSAVTPEALTEALAADDIVLTAPSGVDAFTELVGCEAAAALRIVTIGPTTSEAARHAGLTVSAESAEQSVDGLIAAIRSLPAG